MNRLSQSFTNSPTVQGLSAGSKQPRPTYTGNHHPSHTNKADDEISSIDESDSASVIVIDNDDGIDVNHSDSAEVTSKTQDPGDAETINFSLKPLHRMNLMEVLGPHSSLIEEMLEAIKSGRRARKVLTCQLKSERDQCAQDRIERQKAHLELRDFANKRTLEVTRLKSLNQHLEHEMKTYRCAICHSQPEEKTECGHGYCSNCMREWRTVNSSCPTCAVNLLKIISRYSYD